MISATSGVSSASHDHSARETRGNDDHASDFAAMLAGAVHSNDARPEPKKAIKEGTSELDKPEEKNEETEEEGKKKVKRSRPRPAAATGEVVQSTAALDPEMQAKLARVIARMEQETGHDVSVAETYRSQDRQNTLFAQGRDTAGPVVTWTRNSKHTQGRAVDIVLDGGDAGLDAYTTLQRIANEEGLRTLGARDPGHLELPGSGQPLNANVIAKEIAKTPVAPADASSPGSVNISQLAQVAQVAEVAVARPAEVARVATVARPGTAGVAPASENAQNPVAVVAAKAEHGAATGSGEKNGGESKGEHRGGYSSLAAAVAMRNEAASNAFTVPVAAAAHVSGADRAAQIIAAYQDAPARPLSQITMNVDAGNGVTDRVQLSMRGASLNAAIDAGDTRGAQAMTQRADELVRALTKDGVEVESLRVRAAATATTTNTVAGSQQSQSGSDASTNSRFERNAWQQHDRQRDGRRQQQRNQRGGQD